MAKPRKGEGGGIFYLDSHLGKEQDAELHLLPSFTKLTFPVSTQHPHPIIVPIGRRSGIKQEPARPSLDRAGDPPGSPASL